MNIQEADTDAKRRWGPKAKVQVYPVDKSFFEVVVDIAVEMNWKPEWGPLTRVIGFGKSFEEAIENAIAGQYNL